MANSVEKFPRDFDAKSKKTFHSSQKTTNKHSSPSPENVGAKSNLSQIPTPPRTTKKFSPLWRGFLWGLAFSATAAISATVGATFTLMSPFSLNLASLLQNAVLPKGEASSQSQADGWGSLLQYDLSRPVNILVMGIDRVSEAQPGSIESFAGRSDTMLLLRFDPSDDSVRMLSIPRDSRVEIPGVGFAKINNANVHGGPALAARVVSKTLDNVPIDRYVRVTTDAYKELVDLVGGVEVFVPRPMSYKDVTQNLEINLEAGWQTLNGEQAEQFARFRSDQYGDIGRVQRQQILLKALQKRLYSPAILSRLPQAMRVFQQYIDTNLSLEEMLALANFGKALEKDNLKMVMLPGRFSQSTEYEASYWIINSEGRDRVMQDYFNSESEIARSDAHHSLNQIRITLQNATDDPSLANRMLEYLAHQNIVQVHLMQDSSQLLGETEIVVQQGDLNAAESLKSLLGVGRVEASSTGDLESDLTIRLGIDAKQLLVKNNFFKDESNLLTNQRE